MLTIYGIANCDTIKKTRRWLEAAGYEFEFHDYKKLGCSAELAETLIANIPLEELVNKRGTTWRKLSEHEKENLTLSNAAALIQRETSVIKRPIIHNGDKWQVGFNEDALRAFLSNN